MKSVDAKSVYIVAGKGNPLYNRQFFGPIRENDIQNAYLWVIIARELGIYIKYIEKDWKPLNGGIYNQLSSNDSLYKRIKRIILWKKDEFEISFVTSKAEVLLSSTNFSEYDERLLANKSKGRIRRISIELFRRESNRIIGKYKRNINKREKILNGHFDVRNEFEEIAIRLFIHSAPVTYFEACKELYDKAIRISKKWKYKKIITTQSTVELAAFSFSLAKRKGAEIFGCQHAHQYSVALMTPIGDMMCSDHYITWGWSQKVSIHLGHDLIPIGRSTRLYNYPRTRKKDGKILMVSTTHGPSTIGEGVIYERYLTRELDFLSNLDSSIRSRLVLRVRLKAENGNDILAKICRQRFPEITIETELDKSLIESVQESDFAICDYLGTPELDIIMCGTPLVFLHTADLFVLNRKYVELMNKFEKAGIYARSVDQMINIVNKCANSQDWLCNKMVLDLYREYLHEFSGSNLFINEGAKEVVLGKYYDELVSDSISSINHLI